MAFTDRLANRGSVSTGDYEIDNSCKLEADNSEYLKSASISTTPTNAKIGTYSCWIKRTELGAVTNLAQYLFVAGNSARYSRMFFNTSDQIQLYAGDSSWNSVQPITNAVYRDIAAWYHIVLRIDTTDGTAANRLRLYVNGVEQTWGTAPNINQNATPTLLEAFGSPGYHAWGANLAYYSPSAYFSGYLAEVHYVDGQSLAPTEFGEFDEDSGIWKVMEYSGSHGNCGYYMDFADADNLGDNEASTGSTFDFSENNIAAADQATDTPTNNFCTLNPLAYNITHTYTLSEGNTKYEKNGTGYEPMFGTHFVGAGKWYWEIKTTEIQYYYNCRFGIIDAHKPTVNNSSGSTGYHDPSLSVTDPDMLVMSGCPNTWYINGVSTIANNGSTNPVDYTFHDGDIIAIALDMDNGAYWMGNADYLGVANGSFWIAPGGTATSASVATTDPTNGNYALVGDGGGTNNGTPNFNGGTVTGGNLLTAGFTLVTPLIGAYMHNQDCTLEVNFGGYNSYGEDGGYADANGYGNFANPVPSGFYALCSKNIGEFGGSG
jgi:hypothetical protein